MKAIRRILLFVFFTLIITGTAMTQVKKGESFQEYKKQETQRYNNYVKSETKAYQQYEREEQQGIEKLRKEIEQYWGAHGYVTSTKKNWVEYSKDKKVRTDVDFKQGTATVEVLLTPKEAGNAGKAREKIEKAIKDLVISKGKTKDYSTPMEKPKPLENTPVLKGQLQTDNGTVVTADNAMKFAREVLSQDKMVKKTIKGTDGKIRTSITVKLSLAPYYIKVRALKYENDVNKYAIEFHLPTDLIYAVIHTESYFNPKARSSAPAYGLMQLVPFSGARDAFNFVYNRDKIPTANYLYQANNNIELGTAYLRLLIKRDFKNVRNPNSQILCAIAAYNTGAGNVAITFTGTTNLAKAIPKINAMGYAELYAYLRKYLPSGETRDYIKKVSTRMKMYSKWEKTIQ